MATSAPEVPGLARDLAFERLYRRYLKDVYHYALALLRNPADAEDVTQTTFLNAYRALQRGEEPLKPHNWLIKIAHNAARTRYARASRRVKEVPLEEHVDSLVVSEEEKPDIHAVLDALGRLPLNQRAALVMRELEGRSYGEIAEMLGVSVPAVETLIFRARRSLKLNASAIRVLGVVQLPPALAQLAGGGGIVAGGGATIVSGFVLKTMIAVVAGAVATGVVGGDPGGRAQAAGIRGAVAAPGSAPEVGVLARADAFAAKPAHKPHVLRVRPGGVAGWGNASRRHFAFGEAGRADAPKTGGGEIGRGPGSPPSSARTSIVEPALNAVATVTKPVPPLPVPVPAAPVPVPQVPVSVPEVPVPVPQPSLPATPQPAVPAVSLPPAPPLPTLP